MGLYQRCCVWIGSLAELDISGFVFAVVSIEYQMEVFRGEDSFEERK